MSQEGARLPLKARTSSIFLAPDERLQWIPPESFDDNVFTSQSDVWSFGVVLWEMFSFGASPYPALTAGEAVQAIRTGYRMPPPRNCPGVAEQLMTACWQHNPSQRPTFAAMCAALRGEARFGPVVLELAQDVCHVFGAWRQPH